MRILLPLLSLLLLLLTASNGSIAASSLGSVCTAEGGAPASCSIPASASARRKATSAFGVSTPAPGNDCYPRASFSTTATSPSSSAFAVASTLRGGGGGGFFFIPAGWNPLGYKITPLGDECLKFDGALAGDLGRFLASLKAGRKRTKALKASWLEILRASKTGQAMRIYRNLDDFILFSLRAGLID